MKKDAVKGEEKLDNIAVFSLITVMAAVILLPICLLVEGWQLTPAHLAATVCRGGGAGGGDAEGAGGGGGRGRGAQRE